MRRSVVRLVLPFVVATLLGGCAASATSSPPPPAAATASKSSGVLYWANDAADGTIGRASIDGTNVNQKLIAGLEYPCGVAIVGSFIYWGNIGSAVTGSSIGRANLDGTGVNQSFITRTDAACGVASDGTHLYWANTSAGTGTTIGRANLDGTEAEQSFITGALGPCGVAVDSTHIYWANKGYNGAGSTIGRANLDGTGVKDSFITGASSPCGVAVDSAHVYWSNYGDGGSGTTIGRANLDGTAANQSFISGAHGPCGVASDGTHLYWGNAMTSQGAGTTIGRANLDGGGVNQSFISGANGPCGLGFATVAPTSALATAAAAASAVASTPATVSPTIGKPGGGARIVAVTTVDARTRDLTIESPAVGTVRVRLLLPSAFDTKPSTRWPVLYLLHGATQSHVDWTANTDVETLTAPTNLLVVTPDAGSLGYYADWWNGGNGGPPEWETFHLVELRQLLERNWHAGDKRVIAGLSMGGYGAIEYAERQPGMFLAAASFSGVLDTVGGHADTAAALVGLTWPTDLWGDPVAQADVWKAHDPTDNAAALKGTALYVAYGNGQPGPLDASGTSADQLEVWIAPMNDTFVHQLAALKIPVTVDAYGAGTHTWPYWQRDLHRSLPLLLKALGE